jgi:CBS domain containing-hemolysin-like protein
MIDVLAVVVIVFALLVAAFCAMAETAITRVGRAKAHHLAQENGRKGETLVQIVEDPAPYLNVVLFLMLLAHVGGTAIATKIAIDRFGRTGPVIATAVMTLGIFILAEVVPKTFTVQRTDRAALFIARPVRLLGIVLKPLGKVLIGIANAAMVVLPGHRLPKGPFVTEDEIRHMVDVAEEEEEIEEDERELIHSIFEFGDTVVREVMVPRPDMVTIPSDSSLEDALATIVEAGYSRIPLYEGDNDNIVGVLYAKDALKRIHESSSNVKVRSLARQPAFVPEQKKVAELLREMQSERVHMAIVVDEYGGTAGLVTIEDLIEEIVGEIVDEYDQEEPLVEPIDDVTIRVDAKMAIDEVNELLGAELPHEEWDTVGGLVFGLTGRVPAQGERVKFDSLEFITERVTGRRVQKVVIRKLPVEPRPDEPS